MENRLPGQAYHRPPAAKWAIEMRFQATGDDTYATRAGIDEQVRQDGFDLPLLGSDMQDSTGHDATWNVGVPADRAVAPAYKATDQLTETVADQRKLVLEVL